MRYVPPGMVTNDASWAPVPPVGTPRSAAAPGAPPPRFGAQHGPDTGNGPALLDGGSHTHEVFGGDQMVVAVVADRQVHPVHRPIEAAGVTGVVLADRRSRVAAHIARLITRVDHGYGGVDPPFAGRRTVDEQRDGTSLGQSPTVVGELHPDLVGADRNGRRPLDVEPHEAGQVVAVLGFAVLQVQAPAGEGTALGHDDTVAT